MAKKNISQIVQNKLCNSCGACFAVCKTGAIKFKETIAGNYFPVIDEDSCINCGLCYSVCPGMNFSLPLLEKMGAHVFEGQVINSFVGKALNPVIYNNSQSGGIVSSLILHALEFDLADAAITVAMTWGKPSRPEIYLSRSIEDIVFTQKSKYCPVPTLCALKDVIHSEKRIIFVGTPCQIHGLHNIINEIPKLEKNISLIIGLICDRVMTYAAIDFLIRKAKVQNKKETLLIYRDKKASGYPGDVNVQASDGYGKLIPAATRMKIKDYFTPVRCRICFDKMNIFSDITVGDPHGLDDVDRENGESVFVARTKAGQDLIVSAMNKREIDARPVEFQAVVKGQQIENKKKQWRSYIEIWKKLNNGMPNYYNLVKQHAPDATDENKYDYDIQYSLKMDDFKSRYALIKHVKSQMLKNEVLRFFFLPFRFFRLIFYKLLFLLKVLKPDYRE